ncbi:MAG: hypothetical protein ACE5MI_02695, partial [Acidimicrobiia bacterium]
SPTTPGESAEDLGLPVVVLEDEDLRATEMTRGWIFVEHAGGAPYLAPGHSITRAGEHTLFVNESSVLALAEPGHTEVLRARDLSAEEVLAVAGIRHSMFVLTETGGRGALYHIPLWSDVLRTPLSDVESRSASPLVVFTLDPPFTEGRILVAPDQSTIAVEAVSDGDVSRTSVLWVGDGPPPCWPAFNGICHLAQVQGTPVDFSPDGHWLLARDGQGRALLVSTRGRGAVPLDLEIPDRVAWTAP